MMRRSLVLVAIALASGLLLATAEDSGSLGFGFGGGGVAAFFPNLAGVSTYLSENGLDPLGEFLIGGGGGGRGGVIGGMSFGGMGFGLTATSAGLDRSAELAVGVGGFDLGFAVGGDESSVLTLGAVLGGGASVLELSFSSVQPMGIVPEPLSRMAGRAFAMVMPYVSFEAQVLAFVGLEVRIGYLVPVVGFDFGDLIGITAPSLDLSGPFVSACVVFGGIAGGAADAGEPAAEMSGSLELAGTARLALENRAGDIVVASYAADVTQTRSRRIVEWSASCEGGGWTPPGNPPVDAQSGPKGMTLRTLTEGRVDYMLRVPSGTDLELVNGVGTIHIVGHTANQIRVSLGAGELSLTDVSAGDLSLSVGVGEISVHVRGVGRLDAHAGIGRIGVTLPPGISASVSASAGLGETLMEGFAGMTLRESRFFLTTATEAVLGAGASDCVLSVGIGQIEVRPAKPLGN